VAIVDDEPLVRQGIARQLGAMGDVTLVGEAGDGAEAVRMLMERRPDLVFLDVQMPECDGFEVLRALPDDEAPPAVVFVTAYDAYAIRAFEVHAVDYLLKPFDEERFAVALARARERLEGRSVGGGGGEAPVDLSPLLRELAAGGRTSRRLAVRSRGRIRFVDVEDVDWVEAAGNYARLHVGDEEHLHRSALGELADRFPGRLLRIHRSTLVAADRVREIRPRSGGDATLVLRDGTELRLSRTWREEFEARMTGETGGRNT
jgi:two-component system LytT family response regulator